MTDFNLEQAFGGLHARFDGVEKSVKDINDRTVRTETKMEALVGNGQPGEISHIKNRIGALEKYKERSLGYIAGVVGALTALGAVAHWAIDNFGKH